ncbi:NUDIX hydrolase [Ignavibacterium album]|uniref:NUDIX hydrolase n=1 Tax=Ignavibacterium album TaxID=591197 RepID=UPI0002D2B863|nr:CoA pyrophosphatase [Ignavibacterium album]
MNSAVLIPIVIIESQEYLLFEKRSVSVRQPGEISFPGGHFDKELDADFMDTAIRETIEELGIQRGKVAVLGKIGTLVTPMGIIVETFVGKLDITSLEELNYDKKEVDKIFLVPLGFFINAEPEIYENQLQLHPFIVNEKGEKVDLLPVKELGLPERYANPWKKGKHRVIVYRYKQEIIWGITAELIYELVNRIKKINE